MNRDLGEPSHWVARYMHLAPAGTEVLDVACGRGRHTALFLASGHKVTATDRDISQLAGIADDARVEACEADLEGGQAWPFANRTFGAVVVTNYLHRPLFGDLLGALMPEGVLIYETFAAGNEQFGKPSNPDFLLRPGELMEAVAGNLMVVAYVHGLVQHPRPAVVQRICAVRAAGPAMLRPR